MSQENQGLSWRVGVHPPVESGEAQGSVAAAVLAKNTKAALMQVELGDNSAEQERRIKKADEVECVTVLLWKAEMVAGCIEMDKAGTVTKPATDALHSSGLLFGMGTPALTKMAIGQLVELPRGSNAEWLLKDDKVRHLVA